MGVFKDAKEVEKVFSTFISQILAHPLIGPKLSKSKMIIQFQYTDPDCQVTINFKDPAPEGKYPLVWGETPLKPDVMFRQSADFSNRFWQGKENVIAAMAKRQVTAQGSITKALQLIPIIRPSFRIYPKVLEDLGMKNLIVGGSESQD
ncbi:MAG: SCP2 sterol-binding domain-containing protein [Bdellovibrio sp.]|nr:SCP2 sterol-binding domain-containing protein [Bdellovibrio sp.]